VVYKQKLALKVWYQLAYFTTKQNTKWPICPITFNHEGKKRISSLLNEDLTLKYPLNLPFTFTQNEHDHKLWYCNLRVYMVLFFYFFNVSCQFSLSIYIIHCASTIYIEYSHCKTIL
jgi:hypothetical protein